MKTETVNTSDIKRDPRFQVRESINTDTINRYAELIREGVQFPPLKLGRLPDGLLYLLCGWHRDGGFLAAGITERHVEIHDVDEAGALEIAIKGNATHGLKMEKGDYRRAVKMAYSNETLRGMSTTLLAEWVGCTQQYVSKIKNELSAAGEIEIPERTTGADGKSYPSATKGQVTTVVTSPDPVPANAAATASAPGVAKPPVHPTPVEGDEASDFDEDDDEPPYSPIEEKIAQDRKVINEWVWRFRNLVTEIPITGHLDQEWIDTQLKRDIERVIGQVQSRRAEKIHTSCEGRGCSLCRNFGYLPREMHRQLEGY